jgi:hypothetical protein
MARPTCITMENNHVENLTEWRSWPTHYTPTRPEIGRPLSPMLFILAIDPLQCILDKATMAGADPMKMRTSLYADDVALFLKPPATDVANLHHPLQHFGKATRLTVNIQKSKIFPIQCTSIDVSIVRDKIRLS